MTESLLNQARRHYLDGALDVAEPLFRKALSADPNNADALHGLGLIALDRTLVDDAIVLFKQAAAADPAGTQALIALGAAFTKAGLAGKATTVLAEAVKRAPDVLEPRLHLARAFSAADRPKEALRILDDTVRGFSDDADAWALKGRVERVLSRLEDAYESFGRAAELNPDDPNILNDFGVACRAIGKWAEAAAQYKAALALKPDLAVAHANLGNVLDLLGHPENAEQALRQALALDPKAADARYNLACVLTKLEQPAQALPLFDALAAESPDRWDVQTNLGVACLALGDLDRAEKALRKALDLKPGNPEAQYNLAWLLLLTGRHTEGWAALEARWQLPEFSSSTRVYSMPAWDGEDLAGGTLLLHAEQGLGDTIQFVRFAAEAKARCGRVILACQAPLNRLLSGLNTIDEIVAMDQGGGDADAHAALLSLPRLLEYDGGRTDAANGYVDAPDIPTRLRLPDRGRRRIGLVWAGSPDNKIERRRAMSLEMFLPLLDARDADIVSLQVGPAAVAANVIPAERLVFACDGKVTDFADTAAVVSQLDLVIGVDTSVIHLSGAMGVPTWTLLPFMPDYRWGLGRDSTPWYDSMRLFRQPQPGDWDAVIESLCAALRAW